MRRVPDCLPEHFYAEHVSQDLFRLAVKVRVDERHVIVGGDAVAEGAEALHERNSEAAFWLHPKKTRQDTAHLLHSLHNHLVGERVAYVGQLLVGSRAGQDEPLAVADAQAANDAAAGYAAAGGGREGGRGGREETGGWGGCEARTALTCAFTHEHNPRAAPGTEHGDVVGKLRLEHGVKVFAAPDGDHGVSVGQLGEDADFVAVFELSASGHCGVALGRW
jgi:hypothetical protein